MSADGVLQILPHRGLDQSILLAILVGLLVLLVFTETMGWVFVGLVVPGYLSSVFVVEPLMGITICVEAVITYVLVRFLSDTLAKTTIWSPFFGRERFFLIVLVSVIVRQNSQVWLLPTVLDTIDSTFGTNLAMDSTEFTSIGLVLVPLVANMFWKINLRRGLYQVSIPVIITYLILIYVLLPYTNLSFSNVEITYDNVALNFLNTPKAYIIMLVGAIIAARFNLLYGWDYNGILVPSLLALGWLEPKAIVITIVEALVLFGVTKLVLANPMLRTVNLEGPRQVALVFSLSFIIKYLFSWLLLLIWPQVNVIDYFGYGYVITSLLTTKMLQKKVIGRILFPAILVSFIAFVCGSVIGFGLEQIAPRAKPEARVASNEAIPTKTILQNPLGAMVVATVRARATPRLEHAQGRPKKELERYGELWEQIDVWLAKPSPQRQRAIKALAESLGLSLQKLAQKTSHGAPAYVLLEHEERLELQSGWDTAVLIPGAPGPVIEVPRPRTETPVAELAAVMCERVRCRAIVVSGIDSADGGRSTGDGLGHSKSTFFVAGQRLRSAPVVQLRASEDVPRTTGRLHLHHKLPEEVRLDRLWPATLEIDLALEWSPPPGPTARWTARSDLVVLFLHPDAIWNILLDHARSVETASPRREGVTLKDWLRDTFGQVRTLGASQTLPSQSEVRFIDHLLAGRLLEMRPRRVPWLGHLARLIDYQIVELADCVEDASCWVLGEKARPVKHRWGTLAVRIDPPVEPIVIEAPRPVLETGTWQIAFEMWRQAHGRALLVGHDVPVTHGVSKLDPVRYANVATPFHAMHQSAHRALWRDADSTSTPLILQVRGFGSWRTTAKHVVVGLGPPAMEPRQIPQNLKRMLEPDGAVGWLSENVAFAGGEPEHMALTGQGNPQLSFSQRTGGVDMALIWFSQPMRQLYLDDNIEFVMRSMQTAGLPLTPRSILDFLTAAPAPQAQSRSKAAITLDELVALATRYAITQDIAVLHFMRTLAAKHGNVTVEGVWSTELSAPFLVISVDTAREVRRAAVLLSELGEECPTSSDDASPSLNELRAALIHRCRTLTTRHSRHAP